MSSEDLPRLKRVRGAYRASVSRLIMQVEETLAELTDQSTTKLQQLKESLKSKLWAILLLDGKILNLTAEEELEHDVQQADETRKKMTTFWDAFDTSVHSNPVLSKV